MEKYCSKILRNENKNVQGSWPKLCFGRVKVAMRSTSVRKYSWMKAEKGLEWLSRKCSIYSKKRKKAV